METSRRSSFFDYFIAYMIQSLVHTGKTSRFYIHGRIIKELIPATIFRKFRCSRLAAIMSSLLSRRRTVRIHKRCTKLCDNSVARRNNAKFTFHDLSLLFEHISSRKLNTPASMVVVQPSTKQRVCVAVTHAANMHSGNNECNNSRPGRVLNKYFTSPPIVDDGKIVK